MDLEEQFVKKSGALGVGLVIGKFYPPHLGHLHLLEFAANFDCCTRINVLVDSRPGDDIPGSLRAKWLRAQLACYPHVQVFNSNEEMPQEPEDHPDFWNLWKKHIQKHTYTQSYDWVFASEPYGQNLADLFTARFMPVDINRESTYGISGTKIRSNPLNYIYDIIPAARPHFVKKVCIFGSESVGKTTLARELALSHSTVWVQEYARPYLEFVGPEVTQGKLLRIMYGQAATERALINQASNGIIFKDTDLFATILWANLFMGEFKFNDKLEEMALARKSDLYIVPDTNIPFEQDILRYGGDVRQMTTADAVSVLERYNLPYKVLTQPDHNARMQESTRIIQQFFGHVF